MNLFPKFALVALLGAFCASPIQADYIYEANQSLYDLQTNSSGSTGLGSNDDAVSSAFNIGFTFDFYGQSFTQARMATNGCLHFKTSGAYCNDYTPDPLTGQHTYTLYPFWTDLIKDNDSAMKAKAFADYTIFGWYKMREYNQSNTDNSFEVWLYPNDTFEFRYGELDIDSHDVLIGEIGSGTSEAYTYYYHDECNTGSTNASNCVSINWNSIAMNSSLENGGSLYGVGTGNALDCSSALNNEACPGYAAAYLTQQCDINSLYSNSCTGYAAAYLAQQCALDSLYDSACPYYASTLFDADCEDDPQFSPACAGYTQEASVAYYTEYEEDTYGYEEDSQYGYDEDGNAWAEEDMWYDEEYDEYLDPNDPCFENRCEGFTDADWYALDIEEFGQEQVDLLYGTEVAFDNEGMVNFSESTHSTYDDLDTNFDIMDQEMEEYHAYVDDLPELFEIEEFSTVTDYIPNDLLEEFEFQVLVLNDTFREEEEIFEEFENIEEFEEWYEEEMEEYFSEEVFTEEEYEEELYAEEEIFEEEFVEEIFEDIEELREELIEEELLAEEGERAQTEELLAEETPELVAFSEPARQSDRSSRREAARRIVAGTIAAATRSTDYSGSTAGTSATQTGTSVASGGASSTGGISVSSSPSISDQFSSASQQTQQVLSMSPSTAVASSSVGGGGTTFASSSSSSNSSNSSSTVVASNTSSSSSSDSSTSGSSTSESSVGSSSVSITPMPGIDGTATGAMVDVQVSNLSGEIDTAMSGAMTASEADTIADQIVAANIEEQQEQGTTTQEETGKYGDESTLVAYLGYVPGFNAYTSAQLPKQTSWYEPTSLDGGYIEDNIQAFYQLAGTNIRNMTAMVNSQPNLLGE